MSTKGDPTPIEDFKSLDGELVVLHSPDPDRPFYYVAGRLLASDGTVPDATRLLIEGGFEDVGSQESLVGGIQIITLAGDVIRALELLASHGLGDSVAPEYVFMPSSHKNVYAASPPQPATDPLDEQSRPCSPTVGVIDVGFADFGARTGHMELPVDYPHVPADLEADFGHGESVAWIVSRYAPSVRVVGVSVQRILPSGLGSHGAVTDTELARGIFRLLCDPDVGMITITLGGMQDPKFPSIATRRAIEAAAGRNVLVVAAAGNEGRENLPIYPAAWPTVLGVGASALDGATWKPSSYTNYGDTVDVMAPGTHVVPFVYGTYHVHHKDSSTSSDFRGKARIEGTSFAVPVIAGILACSRWRAYLAAVGNPRERALTALKTPDTPLGLV